MLFEKLIFLQLKEFVKRQNIIYIYIKFILLDKKIVKVICQKKK